MSPGRDAPDIRSCRCLYCPKPAVRRDRLSARAVEVGVTLEVKERSVCGHLRARGASRRGTRGAQHRRVGLQCSDATHPWLACGLAAGTLYATADSADVLAGAACCLAPPSRE